MTFYYFTERPRIHFGIDFGHSKASFIHFREDVIRKLSFNDSPSRKLFIFTSSSSKTPRQYVPSLVDKIMHAFDPIVMPKPVENYGLGRCTVHYNNTVNAKHIKNSEQFDNVSLPLLIYKDLQGISLYISKIILLLLSFRLCNTVHRGTVFLRLLDFKLVDRGKAIKL